MRSPEDVSSTVSLAPVTDVAAECSSLGLLFGMPSLFNRVRARGNTRARSAKTVPVWNWFGSWVLRVCYAFDQRYVVGRL